MEFLYNDDQNVVEVVGIQVENEEVEAENVEIAQNIRKVALLNGTIHEVFDDSAIDALAERENIKQNALQEQNVTHVKPAYLGMRRPMCDYTGKPDDLREVHIPYEHNIGIMCNEKYVQIAVKDCISYCEENFIFPACDLKQFMEERGFKFFNVLRTSGTIESVWQIEKGYAVKSCTMPETQEGGCGIYLEINIDTPEYLHKPISINRLCRMNDISPKIKEEMLIYLKQQLYDYYGKYLKIDV